MSIRGNIRRFRVRGFASSCDPSPKRRNALLPRLGKSCLFWATGGALVVLIQRVLFSRQGIDQLVVAYDLNIDDVTVISSHAIAFFYLHITCELN